jgi:transposase
MNSLLHYLQTFSNLMQRSLFPAIEQELGSMTDQHRTLVATVMLLDLDGFVTAGSGGRGRPSHSRANVLRAFVAKAVFGVPHTRALLARLQVDSALRRICGWNKSSDVPGESTFSRVFDELSAGEVPQRVHEALIRTRYAGEVVGHVSRDATAIEGREKNQAKTKEEKKKHKKKRASRAKDRTPEQMTRIERQSLPETKLEDMVAELPRICDKGTKNDSKGLPHYWVGYKLHMDVADGQIPITCVLTSASLHDSQVAIPMAHMTASRVTSLYDLMDSAYYSKHIQEVSIGLGHVPIIEPQTRGGVKPELAPHERVRFRERTTAERVFSRMKDEFGACSIRVRGHVKVMAHLMFGVLALTADQLLRLPIGGKSG